MDSRAGDRIITGGGVSLCIDTTVYLLQNLFGRRLTEETAHTIEYHRAWRTNAEEFPPVITSSCAETAS